MDDGGFGPNTTVIGYAPQWDGSGKSISPDVSQPLRFSRVALRSRMNLHNSLFESEKDVGKT